MPKAAITALDEKSVEEFVSRKWDNDVVPQLVEYIRIPCKSPHFDADWAKNGHMDAAVALAEQWSRAQRIPHARIVGLIECCEESGSFDLPAYLDALKSRIGTVDLVIGLDSGCGNYEQLWMTTSLRGIAAGTLSVEVLNEGVHSGDASGVVPSSFRIARQLLDRLEDSRTGRTSFCMCPMRRS